MSKHRRRTPAVKHRKRTPELALRTRITIAAAVVSLFGGMAVGNPVSASAGAVVARVSTAATDVKVKPHSDKPVRTWGSDRGFVGGWRWNTGPKRKIAGTKRDALYRTERAGMVRFREPVADGTYKVTLRLAEIYWNAAGKRVFDVEAEGQRVLDNVDIFAAVGKNTAYNKSFKVDVTDGDLTLQFSSTVSVAKVSAIAIRKVAASKPGAGSEPGQGEATEGAKGDSKPNGDATPPKEKQKKPDTKPGTKPGKPSPQPTTKPTTKPSPPPPAPAPPAPGAKPGPGNTGVPAGTKLKPVYGDMRLTTPGAVYDSLDIHGFVTVAAPNVTIRNSIIRGGQATTNVGLVTNYDPKATNFVIEDSELVPEYPSVWIDAIKGQNYTARRINAHGTNDIVKIHGDNVRVENSWLHDAVYRTQDPNLNNTPTHNDGVQVLGGRNIRILGNTITGANNAGLQVTQDYSATTDLVFNQNWVDNGGCSVNLAHKKLASMSGITVNQNKFGRNTRIADCAILSSTQTTLVAEGNVWEDNGQPVRVRRNG